MDPAELLLDTILPIRGVARSVPSLEHTAVSRRIHIAQLFAGACIVPTTFEAEPDARLLRLIVWFLVLFGRYKKSL